MPGRWPEVAAELEAEADGPGGVASLHARLADLDPVAAARMLPSNRRRVVRALEVTLGSGRRFSSFGPGLAAYPSSPATAASRFALVGLRLPVATVARRIEERFLAQLGHGFVEEVRGLSSRPAGLSRTARQALGYRELLAHVERGVPLEEATAEGIRRTRSFARRQRAWFGRDPRGCTSAAEPARVRHAGAPGAEFWAEWREWWQENLQDEPKSDCDADREANKWGQAAPRQGRHQSVQ